MSGLASERSAAMSNSSRFPSPSRLPVNAQTIEDFSRTFAPYGFRREAFYPCYGLAEATLIVSGGRRMAGPRVIRVSRERLRDVVGTDRVGTNLAGMLKGAERLGLRARAVKGDWAGLRSVPLPAIAHVKNADGTETSYRMIF